MTTEAEARAAAEAFVAWFTRGGRGAPKWLVEAKAVADPDLGFSAAILVRSPSEKAGFPRVQDDGKHPGVKIAIYDVDDFAAHGPVRQVGFWHSKYEPWFPRPKDFIDENWSTEDRDAVLHHLEHGGRRVALYLGGSPCRLCDKHAGSADFTDGRWYWPEGLPHYLRDHHVRLPQAFVDHVLQLWAKPAHPLPLSS